MNASRLREIVELLLEREKKYQIQKTLNRLNSSLTNLVGSPQEQQHQKEYATVSEQLRNAMAEMIASFEPTQVTLISEIGADRFFVKDISEEIDDWVRHNPITPSVAQQKVQALINERQNFVQEITQLADNLNKRGIQVRQLDEGEAEIGFMLPRALFQNRFDQFISELGVINRIIRAFSEAATKSSPEPVQVKQISTSDPLIFLGLDVQTIALIGGAVTWALHTWKQVEEIRKIRAETENLSSFSKDDVKQIFDDKILKIIGQSIEDKLTEIFGPVDGAASRKNEQRNDVAWALKSILARVERGMTVEVRLLPPKVETAEGENAAEPPTIPAKYSELQKISSQLIFPKTQGTPVMQIPPSEPNKQTGDEIKPSDKPKK
jgi:hypothetical protein